MYPEKHCGLAFVSVDRCVYVWPEEDHVQASGADCGQTHSSLAEKASDLEGELFLQLTLCFASYPVLSSFEGYGLQKIIFRF